MAVRPSRLIDEPEVIEKLRELPEGSQIPNIGGLCEDYVFLRVEGKNEKSTLVLLIDSGLGNMCGDPVEIFYPLSELVYIREDGYPNTIKFPSRFDFKPKKQRNWERHDDYREMLKRINKIIK